MPISIWSSAAAKPVAGCDCGCFCTDFAFEIGFVRIVMTPPVYKEIGYSGLTKTSTALPRLSSKRTIL